MPDAPDLTPLEEEARDHAVRVLRPVFEGRRFLLAGGPVVALAKRAARLRDLGAAGCFLVGDGLGTGEADGPPADPFFVLEEGGGDIVAAMHAAERRLADPPAALRAAVDAWDPEGTALGLVAFTLGDVPAVAGRRRFANRPASWAALEDKTLVDAFLDAAGIPRPLSEVVAAEPGALRAASRRLDRGEGTVLAGDARDGIHGGAVGIRRVGPGEDGAAAAAFLASRCDRVRVTPFLEGIPCSIHGVVFPDGSSAVFRPVEMVVLRPPAGDRFLYAGAATWFDPPPADREHLRSVARRVAGALHRTLGFRGGFTVDGVLSAEGWLPTELNPRLGAGHSQLAAALPGLPFQDLALAAQEGVDLDYRPDLLEEAVVLAADRRRQGGTWTVLPGRRERTEVRALVEEAGAWRPAREGEAPSARVEIGPSPTGGFARITPGPGAVAAGPPLAPWAVRAWAAADALLGTGLGPLGSPRRVR